MTVNTNIRNVRQLKGLTLEQVAKRLGTTAATVSRWEREPQRVTVPTLHNLAGVLQVSPQDLMDCIASPGVGANRGDVIMVKGMRKQDASNPFSVDYLEQVTSRDADDLAIMTVEGDAMEPGLRHGDQALVDISHTKLDRAGLFVFQQGEFAGIRRVIPQIGSGQAMIKPDNDDYGPGHLVDVDKVPALGRIIWVGKKV